MQQSVDAMTVALRVLTALTQQQYPDPQDLATLRELAPDAAVQSADELACEVIQRALKRRATLRERTRSAGD